MSIETIPNRRLYRQIAEQIIRLIEQGEYRPGARLPAERILAEKLEVSRPTVREALIALEVEGWIEIRGGAGVFVLDRPIPLPVIENVAVVSDTTPGPFEVLHARDLLEPAIAALAAKNASETHIRAMSSALANMVCCSASDLMYVEHDRDFHFSLAEGSGNSALLLALQALWSTRERPLYKRLEDHFHSELVWQNTIIEHREILEAIKLRDAKAARQAMHKHLKNAGLRFKANWKE